MNTIRKIRDYLADFLLASLYRFFNITIKEQKLNTTDNETFANSKLVDKFERKAKRATEKMIATKTKKAKDDVEELKERISKLESIVRELSIKLYSTTSTASEEEPSTDIDLMEGEGFNVDKWSPDKFEMIVQNAIDYDAIGIDTIESWKGLFVDSTFWKLLNNANIKNRNPHHQINRRKKLAFYKELLPYISNSNFLRYTMPKNKYSNEDRHPIADEYLWNQIKRNVALSITQLELI